MILGKYLLISSNATTVCELRVCNAHNGSLILSPFSQMEDCIDNC